MTDSTSSRSAQSRLAQQGSMGARPNHSRLRTATQSVLAIAVTLAAGGSAKADVTPAPTASAAPSAVVPAARPQPQAAADETIGKVQAFYDRTTSFRSNFRQQYTATLHNKTVASTGAVVFSKPGKMSWRYEEPAGNRVVSNGTQLRVYEAAAKQMYEQVVDRSQYPAALSFLTGQGKLTDNFTFELFRGEDMNFPRGLVLVGTPKTATPAYKKVLFYVDAATSQVRRVMILDGQGNRNRFDFLEPHLNETVPPAEFVFEAPAGTTVIKP
jgi:outer membrane lipoprotein carrier protein